MITGLHLAEHACLSKVAGRIPKVAARIPEDTGTVVVGDGAFHSTALMDFIENQGWHFCPRLHRDTHVRSAESSSEENTWRQLRDLVPEERERRYLQDVIVARRSGGRKTMNTAPSISLSATPKMRRIRG